MRRCVFAAPIGLLVLTWFHGPGDAQEQTPSPAGRAFTDVTQDSGVADLVAQKYAASPKWWLSGLHLVDRDGDGKLDLSFSATGETVSELIDRRSFTSANRLPGGRSLSVCSITLSRKRLPDSSMGE